MSFLKTQEEYQVEEIAAGLHVSSAQVVRRMIEAAFSHQEEKRLFLNMLALYHEMENDIAAKIAFSIEKTAGEEIASPLSEKPDNEIISFPETLQNYIVHGVAPVQVWRMFLSKWSIDFSLNITRTKKSSHNSSILVPIQTEEIKLYQVCLIAHSRCQH